MKITFRQGIIRAQTSISAPQFVQKSPLTGSSVDIVITAEPVAFTIAHYSADYLFEEVISIPGAWGTGAVGSINGPMAEIGQTQYLFWDVSLETGQLTRGWTLVPPISSALPPNPAVHDMHWFDTSTKRMRVYRKPDPNAPGVWQDKLRVFAATYSSSGLVTPFALGSQVGISDGSYSAGNIILGSNNKPLRQSDGTFVTTESNLIVYQTSSQNVKFDMALVYARASEEIAKFHLVRFTPDRRIALASCTNLYSFVSGIVTEDLYQDDVGQIITDGIIRNEQWTWTNDQINKPLFCGVSGQVTLVPPAFGVVQQVGFVYDESSIFFNLFPPIRIR